MYVARVLYPVEVLGPGKRVGIWFCGCPRRCKGCSNPELWEFQERYKTTPETVFELVKSVANEHDIDGFTITGGDPMYQATDLQRLISLLKEISDDMGTSKYVVKFIPLLTNKSFLSKALFRIGNAKLETIHPKQVMVRKFMLV